METVRKFKHLHSRVNHLYSHKIPRVVVSLCSADGSKYELTAYFGTRSLNEVRLEIQEDGSWTTNFSSAGRNAEDSAELLLNFSQAVDFANQFSSPESWSLFDVG
jgi:hypothetical protein